MKGNKRNTPAHLITSAGLRVAAALRALQRAGHHPDLAPPTEYTAEITARLHLNRATAHLQEAHNNIKDAQAALSRISQKRVQSNP